MVEDLASIIALIHTATDRDSKSVTSAHKLSHAADMLEAFPMTRAHLEATRVGKLLNEVRRFAECGDLQRRFRRLLKSWQPLVTAPDPNFSVVVNGNGGGNSEKAGGGVVDSPPTAPAAAEANAEPQGKGSRKRAAPGDSTPAAIAAAAAAAAAASTAGRLAKVRSTAELLSGREGVTRETLARILNNEVPREPAEQPAAAQQPQPQPQPSRKRRRVDSSAPGSSAASVASASAHAPASPAATVVAATAPASALLDKFLESAVTHAAAAAAEAAELDEAPPPSLSSSSAIPSRRELPNFLHDWPALPPLAAGSSGARRSTPPEAPAGMYSVRLGHGSVHVLPWVDLDGWQRRFFPEDAGGGSSEADAAETAGAGAADVW